MTINNKNRQPNTEKRQPSGTNSQKNYTKGFDNNKKVNIRIIIIFLINNNCNNSYYVYIIILCLVKPGAVSQPPGSQGGQAAHQGQEGREQQAGAGVRGQGGHVPLPLHLRGLQPVLLALLSPSHRLFMVVEYSEKTCELVLVKKITYFYDTKSM